MGSSVKGCGAMRRCAVPGCGKAVENSTDERHVLCYPHYRMLPGDLRKGLYRCDGRDRGVWTENCVLLLTGHASWTARGLVRHASS
jgi:hypothetical protein